MPDQTEPTPDVLAVIAKDALTGNPEARRVFASLLALDILKTWLVRRSSELDHPNLAEAYQFMFQKTLQGLTGEIH